MYSVLIIYIFYKIHYVAVEMYCCYYSLSEIGELISLRSTLHSNQKFASSHTATNFPELRLSPIEAYSDLQVENGSRRQ